MIESSFGKYNSFGMFCRASTSSSATPFGSARQALPPKPTHHSVGRLHDPHQRDERRARPGLLVDGEQLVPAEQHRVLRGHVHRLRLSLREVLGQHEAHPVRRHLVAGHVLRLTHVLQADHTRRPFVAGRLVEVHGQQQRFGDAFDHVGRLDAARLVNPRRDVVGLRQQQLGHVGNQVPDERGRDRERLDMSRREGERDFLGLLAGVVVESFVHFGVNVRVVFLDDHVQRLAALRHHADVRVAQGLRHASHNFTALR